MATSLGSMKWEVGSTKSYVFSVQIKSVNQHPSDAPISVKVSVCSKNPKERDDGKTSITVHDLLDEVHSQCNLPSKNLSLEHISDFCQSLIPVMFTVMINDFGRETFVGDWASEGDTIILLPADTLKPHMKLPFKLVRRAKTPAGCDTKESDTFNSLHCPLDAYNLLTPVRLVLRPDVQAVELVDGRVQAAYAFVLPGQMENYTKMYRKDQIVVVQLADNTLSTLLREMSFKISVEDKFIQLGEVKLYFSKDYMYKGTTVHHLGMTGPVLVATTVLARPPSKTNLFFVSVKSLTGKCHEVVCSPGDTILELKQKVYDHTGIPPDQLRLLFRGLEMSNGKTVEKNGIMRGTVIHMILKLRGGMYHYSSGHEDMAELGKVLPPVSVKLLLPNGVKEKLRIKQSCSTTKLISAIVGKHKNLFPVGKEHAMDKSDDGSDDIVFEGICIDEDL